MKNLMYPIRTALLPAMFAGAIGCVVLPTVSGMPQLSGQFPIESLTAVEMPELKGLPRPEAEKRIAAIGYTGSIDWRERDCNAGAAPGTVCDTTPTSGAALSGQTPVVVYLQQRRDRGGEGDGAWVQMPDLSGKNAEDARQFFTRERFSRVSYEEVERADCAPDTVCATSVRPGERALLTGDVRVYVGKKVMQTPQTPATAPTKPAPPAGTNEKKPTPPERPRPADFF